MDERVYWIWLQQALGVGAEQGERLLAEYGDAKTVYDRLTLPFDGLTPAQQKRFAKRDLTAAQKQLDALSAMGAWMLTPADAGFAAMFEGMFAPPMVIYGIGERYDWTLAPAVAVVGTRHCDEAGARITRRLAAGLAAGGAVVVSGGADGIDAHALEAALDENGRCVSFAACGLDVDYPRATAALRRRLIDQGGMLLSEFPLGTGVQRHHFRIRNRLISAVSRGVLVTQAPLKSGALITASWAREQGRDVFAVPGSVGVACCAGSNELLKDGAQLVTNAADVLMMYTERYPSDMDIGEAIKAEERAETAFYHPDRPKATEPSEAAVLKVAQPSPMATTPVPCPETASAEMRTVYTSLEKSPKIASELAVDCQMPLAKVLSVVTSMELKGLAKCQAGQRYALCEM